MASLRNSFTVLNLRACVVGETNPIVSGLVWRVLRENLKATHFSERLQLIALSSGGVVEFILEPGLYLVHVAYGFSHVGARFNLAKEDRRTETLYLNVGGLKLMSRLVGDKPIPKSLMRFDILALYSDASGEDKVIVSNAEPAKIIRLNADRYRVVAHYGDINVVSRAEIHVRPGKLTEATIYHKAAKVTLKLVSSRSRAALANVSWQLFSKTGEELKKVVGAYPVVILSEGGYTVVARHRADVYRRSFSVESGYDQSIIIKAE